MDKELLLRYRAGEPAAFRKLYEQNRKILTGFLSKGFNFKSKNSRGWFSGASDHELEDLISESFARMFTPTTRKNFDGDRPFSTYLCAVAKNLAIENAMLKSRFVSFDEQNIDDWLIPNNEPSPDQYFFDKEIMAVTQQGISFLSKKQKICFSHRCLSGLTQRATSARMGISRTSIKKWEKDIRLSFSRLFQSTGYGDFLSEGGKNAQRKRAYNLQH